MSAELIIAIIITVVGASTPILLAALGELVVEKSGVLNLGIEGMMLIGAVTAFAVTYTTGNAWLGILAAAPWLMKTLSVVGTAAMVWVGGHILLAGAAELGWHGPYDLVHDAEHLVDDVAGVGGALAWLVNTAISAAVGLVVGALVVFVVSRVRRPGSSPATSH